MNFEVYNTILQYDIPISRSYLCIFSCLYIFDLVVDFEVTLRSYIISNLYSVLLLYIESPIFILSVEISSQTNMYKEATCAKQTENSSDGEPECVRFGSLAPLKKTSFLWCLRLFLRILREKAIFGNSLGRKT